MLNTVADLRAFLEDRRWSPEDLAERVPVSNMTWRRLLAKRSNAVLPEKYRSLLAKQFAPVNELGFDVSPEDVVITGMDLKPREVVAKIAEAGKSIEEQSVVKSAAEKLRSVLVPQVLISRLQELIGNLPTATRSARVLIVGGLVYFLNPFDLIADTAVAVGFIDDIGVLGLISQHLRSKNSK